MNDERKIQAAIGIVQEAVEGYCEDCIGSDVDDQFVVNGAWLVLMKAVYAGASPSRASTKTAESAGSGGPELTTSLSGDGASTTICQPENPASGRPSDHGNTGSVSIAEPTIGGDHRYAVLHRHADGGWHDDWTDDPDGLAPTRFASQEDAEAEMYQHLAECRSAGMTGYSEDNYKVVVMTKEGVMV